jgi:cobalt/nickel transport system ATP-binding protein
VSFVYPDGTRALQGLSLDIPSGGKMAVLGANGSGKTTLFLCLNGILRPQYGKILFKGKPLRYDRKSLRALRSRLGIVFQDPDTQLISASVLQEIAFGPLNLGLKEQEALARVEAAMRETGVEDLRDRATHLLSYGQKKRVTIADILAMEPEVVVSDEPTAWLDPEHADKIMELFDGINNKGTTVIISTHDTDLALRFADHVAILKDGALLAAGAPCWLFQNDILLATAGLKMPLVLNLYLHLCERGILPRNGKIPRTASELSSLLQ